MLIAILMTLFGQPTMPADFDLQKVRAAFVKQCKPHMEPWIESGNYIGAGAAIFRIAPNTNRHPIEDKITNKPTNT